MKTKFLVLFLLTLSAYGQMGVKKTFHLAIEQTESNQAFLGNGIIDLLVTGDDLWAATGFGVNLTNNQGLSWDSFSSGHYKSKGGITAIGAMDSSTIWIATAFDTTAQDSDLPAGGGLSYTQDRGQTWTHIAQPVDSRDEQNYSPTTTVIQNLTYDVAFVDSTIWIASFGGGLRRSDNMGISWQVVTTDGHPFEPLNAIFGNNHRAFSLLSENGNLWYGSADGISKSPDNGLTWQRFTHTNQEFPISGNFIVSLAQQQATNTIWAATIEATDQDEIRGVSKSINGGLSWTVTLEGVFAHNFGFSGDTVFVASDEGLHISVNGGDDWYNVPHIRDSESGEEITATEFYSAASQKSSAGSSWWFGSADGLALTKDNGRSWKIIRSFVSTKQRTNPAVYAYPTAFSPSRGNITRFQYDISADTEVVVKIYNFAMEHVVTIKDSKTNFSSNTADRSTVWDGRNVNGDLVASGVYFFKVDIGKNTNWGKVVVIN